MNKNVKYEKMWQKYKLTGWKNVRTILGYDIKQLEGHQRAGRNRPKATHLMFADDLLLFGKMTINQIKTIKSVLNKFCSTSGNKSIIKSQASSSLEIPNLTFRRILFM